MDNSSRGATRVESQRWYRAANRAVRGDFLLSIVTMSSSPGVWPQFSVECSRYNESDYISETVRDTA